MCLNLVYYYCRSDKARETHWRNVRHVLRGLLHDALPVFLGATWTQLFQTCVRKATDGIEHDPGHRARLTCFVAVALAVHWGGMITLLAARESHMFRFISQCVTELANFSWMLLATELIFSTAQDITVLIAVFLGFLGFAVIVLYLGGLMRQVVLPRWWRGLSGEEVLLTNYDAHAWALAVAYALTQVLTYVFAGQQWTFSSDHHAKEDDDDRYTWHFTAVEVGLTFCLICLWVSLVSFIQQYTDPQAEFQLHDRDLPFRASQVPPSLVQEWFRRRYAGNTGVNEYGEDAYSTAATTTTQNAQNGVPAGAAVSAPPPSLTVADDPKDDSTGRSSAVETQHPGGLAMSRSSLATESDRTTAEGLAGTTLLGDIESESIVAVSQLSDNESDRGRDDTFPQWMHELRCPCYVRNAVAGCLEPPCHACWSCLCFGLGSLCMTKVQPRLCFWSQGTVTVHGYATLFNVTLAYTIGIWWLLWLQIVAYFFFASDRYATLGSSIFFAFFATNLGLFLSSKLYVRLARHKSTALRRRRYQLRIVALRLIIGWSWEDVVAQTLNLVKKGNFTIQFTARFLVAVIVTVAAFALEWNKVHQAEERLLTGRGSDVSEDSGTPGARDSLYEDVSDVDDLPEQRGRHNEPFGEYGVAHPPPATPNVPSPRTAPVSRGSPWQEQHPRLRHALSQQPLAGQSDPSAGAAVASPTPDDASFLTETLLPPDQPYGPS